MKNRLRDIFTSIIIGLLACSLASCSDDYKRGYKSGYSRGYEVGEEDGYSRGYRKGTADFVADKTGPTLGVAIILFVFVAAVYFLYKFFKEPSKRAIEDATDKIERSRQQIITQWELTRKKSSVEEQARIRAQKLANKVFEKTIQALKDEESRTVIEEFRNEAEKKILAAQLQGIEKIADEYRQTIESLKGAKNLSDKEKAELFKEIREIFGEV
jgi:F0F1-type ATP synthase membrane subunit b/b'